MDTLDVLFIIGAFLWLISFPFLTVWVVTRLLQQPEEEWKEWQDIDFSWQLVPKFSWQLFKYWWKSRLTGFLVVMGPLIVLAALYWVLRQLL